MIKFSDSASVSKGSPSFLSEKAIRETAAQWVARRHDGLSAAEEQELSQWLSIDRAHAAAFEELGSAWAFVNRPRRAGQADSVRYGIAVSARRQRGLRRIWISSGLGLAAAAALLLIPRIPAPILTPPPTVVLRPNIQTLSDGSTVELNAGAEIAVDFQPNQRNVRLVRGEALFKVAKNPLRPFVVSAAGVAVRAVGTAFSVRYDPKQVGILVTEGKVQVDATAPAPPSVCARSESFAAAPAFASPETENRRTLLIAGQQATVALTSTDDAPRDTRVVPVSGGEIERALAWRGKRVEFTNTPLSEAVKWFNRQNRVQLAIASPVLERRCITGIFWSDDPEGFVRLLQCGVDTAAERSGHVLKLRPR